MVIVIFFHGSGKKTLRQSKLLRLLFWSNDLQSYHSHKFQNPRSILCFLHLWIFCEDVKLLTGCIFHFAFSCILVDVYGVFLSGNHVLNLVFNVIMNQFFIAKNWYKIVSFCGWKGTVYSISFATSWWIMFFSVRKSCIKGVVSVLQSVRKISVAICQGVVYWRDWYCEFYCHTYSMLCQLIETKSCFDPSNIVVHLYARYC